jgi:hypothetical protein
MPRRNLQICEQASSEDHVFARIADEAGVELVGLIKERGHVLNQHVRETTAPKGP